MESEILVSIRLPIYSVFDRFVERSRAEINHKLQLLGHNLCTEKEARRLKFSVLINGQR